MPLEWSEKLSVGNPRIDQQHQELIKRFDQFLEACRTRRGKEEVVSLLDFLSQYVVTHFQDEERQMVRYGYPELASHKEEHAYFIAELTGLSRKMASEGPTLELVVTTNQALLSWVLKHIQNVDVQLGSFLKGRAFV